MQEPTGRMSIYRTTTKKYSGHSAILGYLLPKNIYGKIEHFGWNFIFCGFPENKIDILLIKTNLFVKFIFLYTHLF